MSMKYLGSLSIFEGVHPSIDHGLSYVNYLLSFGNPRVRGWLLMDVGQVLVVAFAYLAIVFLLKYLMRNVEKKDAFQLRAFATLHNINLTLLSLYMCVETIRQALMNNYTLWGNAVDDSPKGDGMANICHIFFLSKILEFIDTFIMALKKNERQITFLHLYHHGSIFVVWWGIVYYTPGGDSYFTCALNSFIHVIMYSYYLWATFARKLKEGERPKPSHPGYYRKYITSMQMTQFMIMMIQAIYVILVPSGYPRMGGYVLFFYMITMLALFGNFFLASYVKGGKKKDENKPQKKDQ